MNKLLLSVCLFIIIVRTETFAQSRIVKDFMPVCDSLSGLITEKSTVKGKLKIKSVMKRGGVLDFYFTESLGDYPWKEKDYARFIEEFKSAFPTQYRNYRLGEIYSNRVEFKRLVTPSLSDDGSPEPSKYRVKDPRDKEIPVVREAGGREYTKGLSGRNIALWQSHGRYYEQKSGRWEWQRACLFQTVEDIFTQSFVLPYLVPMLENAGAFVMLPRERDSNPVEIITDNDPDYSTSTDMASIRFPGRKPSAQYPGLDEDNVKVLFPRLHGTYSEEGKWSDAGQGFADMSPWYTDNENPFSLGTARKAGCVQYGKAAGNTAKAYWRPAFPERGKYAVYVSYKSLPESTESAHYTVRHLGGESHYYVNQAVGGGTWIYLGTFEFDKGDSGFVMLDNITRKGEPFKSGKVVTADAVKIGGGMGNIARKIKDDPDSELEISGMPRFMEGARYWMQWSGTDSTVFNQNDNAEDYMDDFMSRGAWVGEMSGGSRVNPRKKGKGIPFDLSFGFHSDAGVTPNDSTVGTLSIYTLRCEGSQKLPNGEDRMTCREYADLVQEQLARDIRFRFDSTWRRRALWDRSYSESRTPPVPAMLLELLSHQNFADMKYGLNPEFRFTASRAVYKGMLKYLSNRYGCPYQVQPLPVNSLSATLLKGSDGGFKTRLSWKDTVDSLEQTAAPSGYILYVRKDSGAFDNGTAVRPHQTPDGRRYCEIPVETGSIYSFKIEAFNDGGKSFPSEILSVGIPLRKDTDKAVKDSCIMIVNNFDRISSPAYFDTPSYAGFDNETDSGVPYIEDIAYCGQMYQNRRTMAWSDDDNPGFGASYTDFAGKIIAGNTFDYPFIHGSAVFKAGYPFCSVSAAAFASDTTSWKNIWSIDVICGKQVTTKTGNITDKGIYRVFPVPFRNALESFAAQGGNILISGAHIGTDIWDMVFPVAEDSSFRAESMEFAEKVLGYTWRTNYASRTGKVRSVKHKGDDIFNHIEFSYWNTLNPFCYCVDAPDGIQPSSENSKTVLRYDDTNISAGICHQGKGYRTVVLGFPLETVREKEIMDSIIDSTIKFFLK